ncbi:MAG TPA: flagellar assembly protein FliW [Thermotogota bacterium]|nr:flagellar assembly protein FliW [Thermotogota bacterium]HRW93025.1 flagellar assembly protein FliW [Thermotogota bacterium]
MKFRTRLGEIEISEEHTLFFPKGLPGFENLHRFALYTLPETNPIQWLISLDDALISFPVIDPWLIRSDYAVDIPPVVLESLAIRSREKVLIVNMIRIPQDDPRSMTINLLAPILVNLENRQAMQMIMENSDYDLRHPVHEELERSKKNQASKGTT